VGGPAGLCLALDYEDLNDHEELRKDPLLEVLAEKFDPGGEWLAGKGTLNHLELTPATASAKVRYKKIVANHAAVDPAVRGGVPGRASASAPTDHSGSVCHR